MTQTVGGHALGFSKVNGHGLPMVCVHALINRSARPSKAQSVPVIAQLHNKESDRSMKLGLRVAAFT